MSRREWRSLLLLLGLAVAGHLIRAAFGRPGGAPGAISLFDPGTAGDPAVQAERVRDLMRPLAPGERIDLDRVSAAELRRLPGVGPALAARIVADRESLGAFGSIAGLDRVAGVGVGTLRRLAPFLQFGGVPADISGTPGAPGEVDLNHASVAQLDALPGIGPSRARAIVAFRDSAGPFRDISDLRRLPGFSQGTIDRLARHVVLR